MSPLRNLLAVLGGTTFVAGVASVLFPERSAAVSVWAVALFGTDYGVVAVVGLVAIGLAALVGVGRARGGLDQAAPPTPERYPTGPRAGSSMDELLDGRGIGPPASGTEDVDRLRKRFRNAAISVVMREEGCSRRAARERVDDGTWTDDPAVASFLRGDAGSGRPLADGGRPRPGRVVTLARRTATEIAERDVGDDRG